MARKLLILASREPIPDRLLDKESQTFLLAAIALIVAANAVGAIPFIGEVVTRVIVNLVLFLGARS